MKVTDATRSILEYRREQRAMLADGWILANEPRWQLTRGDDTSKMIVDAKPSICGTEVWIKLDWRPGELEREQRWAQRQAEQEAQDKEADDLAAAAIGEAGRLNNV